MLRRINHPATGIGPAPSITRLMLPNAIYFRNVTGLTAAGNQIPAKKAANQLKYGVGESGTFYGYEGIGYGQFTPLRAIPENSTPSLFIVPESTPTKKVLYANSKGEPQPPGNGHELQKYIEAVPVPEVLKVPSGRLTCLEGPDQEIAIWQPSTGKYWEFWRWAVKPPPEGYDFTCQYGGYIENTNEWNGILPNNWGARATSLALTGGLITVADLLEVQKGGKIKHALECAFDVISEEIVAPATRRDAVPSKNTVETHEGKANPAFGTIDAIAESCWFRFPPSSKPSEFGLAKRLEVAVFEAIREYGLFVGDGGAPRFAIQSPVSMGSEYDLNTENPFYKAPSAWGSFPYIPESLNNKALTPFEEEIGKNLPNVFTKQPWSTAPLELLEPRTE